jgi:hypothetical protein
LTDVSEVLIASIITALQYPRHLLSSNYGGNKEITGIRTEQLLQNPSAG